MTNWYARRDAAEGRAEYWAGVFTDALDRRDFALADYAERFGQRAERDISSAEYEIERQHRERVEQRYEREKTFYRKAKLKPLQSPEDDFDDDDARAEWEFGVEYDADSADSSNVDINFRVERNDGRTFTATEARDVMRHLAEHGGDAPRGYRVRAIDWRSPERHTEFKSSRNVDKVQEDFRDVLNAVDNVGFWRLGGVR